MLFSSAAFFFDLRIRTECSEHVNSFIDAYWANVRKKKTHHWKIAFKDVFSSENNGGLGTMRKPIS